MPKVVRDVTAELRGKKALEMLPVPPDVLSSMSGLSDLMGCQVAAQSVATDGTKMMLALTVSPNGNRTSPKSKAIVESLADGAVILGRTGKQLSVMEGNQAFLNVCCRHTCSALNGFSRTYEQIHISLKPEPEAVPDTTGNSNGNRKPKQGYRHPGGHPARRVFPE